MREMKARTVQNLKREGTEIQRYVCEHAENLSAILCVTCPDFIFFKKIIQPGSDTEMSAFTYHKEDYPDLDNSVLLFAESLFEPIYTTGVIAHEMFHIYQKNEGFLSDAYAEGYFESLNNTAEIEADAFAICYMSNVLNLSHKKSASILCPAEKKYNPDAYWKRLNRAKKISNKFSFDRGSVESVGSDS